jgi:glyoxylase-like metal-dependent hydrolase (beta-lactamase superfamily II)/rhodanese-related sulfurtransferase
MVSTNVRITAFVDEGLGHSSYLVDLGAGQALIIDPPRLPTAQLDAAEARGVTVSWTADTHSHADYVSGSPELHARGATFLASASAWLKVPHLDITDGDEVVLHDGLVLRAIATPGHTPDHLAYLLVENSEPVALFSGGSLMVGTVGRTDLLGPEPREQLTRHLFRALRDRIMVLPDDLPVYPTHGAGSFCSAPGASARTTTIGKERATNELLSIDGEDDFVDAVLAGLGSFPSYFARLPEVNRRGPRLYGSLPELPTLDLEGFRAVTERGAVVIDARPVAEFAAGHVPGALSIALRPVFASWLGWLVEPEADLVFVLDRDQDARELVRQCLSIGYEHLVGALDGGMAVWTDAGFPASSIPLVHPSAVVGTVVDVRQRNEFAGGHLPGARNIELGSIRETVIPDGLITVMCGHGERAMTGASILEAHRACDLRVLVGGPDDWAAATGETREAG